MLIEVWSDYVCPFCYLQEPVVARLESEFAGQVQVRWRAYELRPEPEPTLDPAGEYLRDIWASAVYPMAAKRGMTLKLPPVQPRSRKAFEATEYARDRGKADAMRHAVFAAFFEGGRDIGDLQVLGEIGEALDIHSHGLRRALEAGVYTQRVVGDENEAAELGLSGVPAMVLTPQSSGERRMLISGAQPYETVREFVERAL
ncbi:MAG: DsbA family oxidoreductase [Verrucomicrobiota bacterium]|nr:DsbA family oxidoreductase [Verrucomicrobiota bacterium]